jgi:hypothetical protein
MIPFEIWSIHQAPSGFPGSFVFVLALTTKSQTARFSLTKHITHTDMQNAQSRETIRSIDAMTSAQFVTSQIHIPNGVDKHIDHACPPSACNATACGYKRNLNLIKQQTHRVYIK